jgi:hypothetical protein
VREVARGCGKQSCHASRVERLLRERPSDFLF